MDKNGCNFGSYGHCQVNSSSSVQQFHEDGAATANTAYNVAYCVQQ